MMEKTKLVFILISSYYFLFPTTVKAIITISSPGPNPGPAGVLQLQQLIQRIIALSAGLAFMALTIMLVYAGIRYIISHGEAKNIQLAHQTATWAILGIVFLIIAWLILKLIEVFTGVNVTNFCIGFPGVSTACPEQL